MGYSEQELRQMAKDPRFMANRWKQRLAVNEKELQKRWGSLSSEERAQKQAMLAAQYKRVKRYEAKAKKEGKS